MGGDVGEQGVLDVEAVGHVEGAADEAAEDVAAAFVGGERAVGDQEGHGAAVFGDDAHGAAIGVRGFEVIAAAALADVGEQRREEVGLVEVLDALQHHRPALEACAGVDVLGGQRGQLSTLVAGVLHEDEVPDFEEAVLVIGRAGIGRGRVRPHVVVQFGAGAAGADGAGGPEIALIFAVSEDAGIGQADLAPLVVGEIVVGEDGGDQAVCGDADHVGDQLPGPGLGLGLEVVAEREVAEHLEHGQVRVVADLVDVGGAEALLDRGEAVVRRLRFAHEVALEGDHAGAGEEQGGVAGRGQRGAGDAEMVALGEEVGEGLPDLLGVHLGLSSG